MKGTRKKYDAKFKAKVALEAIKERETLNELAVKYEVSPVMISRWKKEFIENSAAAFETPKVDDVSIEKEKNSKSNNLINRTWKSPVCVTPEAQVPLTLESKFRMTPIKS